MRKRLTTLAVIALGLAGLDQLIKALMVHWLIPGVRQPIINGLLDLQLVYNRGAAFGSLAGLDQARWILAALTVLAIILAIWLVKGRGGSGLIWAMGLICGGALGNLVDRLRLGLVVDFVLVYFRQWHWPNFNLADSAITVGGVMLAWLLITRKA